MATISEIQNFDRKGLVLAFFSNSDSFPQTVNSKCVAFAAINNDVSDMTFTLYYVNGGTITGTIPANSAYDGTFLPFNKISISGSNFQAEVRQ